MLRCERPVETDKTGLFIGLQIFRKGMDRRPDRGYGPDRLWSGPVSVFFQSCNWTSKH